MTSFAYWQSQSPDGQFLCQICFETYFLDRAFTDANGGRWDVCVDCRAHEDRVLVALAFHDVTCPEGPDCRSRVVCAISDPLFTSGVLESFLERHKEMTRGQC